MSDGLLDQFGTLAGRSRLHYSYDDVLGAICEAGLGSGRAGRHGGQQLAVKAIESGALDRLCGLYAHIAVSYVYADVGVKGVCNLIYLYRDA